MRLLGGGRMPISVSVSIHASVKDATIGSNNSAGIIESVSIHASVKDATKDAVTFPTVFLFQSTHL